MVAKNGSGRMAKPTIVILGAGYAGLTAALTLQKNLTEDDAKIILVNKHSYHYQTTWLHENAAGSLHDNHTKISIDKLIDQEKIECLVDTVTEIRSEKQHVCLAEHGCITYDYLVVALGFEMNTFNIPGVTEYAYTIGSIDKSSHLRQQMDNKLAAYSKQKSDHPFTIVVGGGGFTGVEYLGELTDQLSDWCKKYQLTKQDFKLITIEREHSVMPGFNLELGEYAMQALENKGITFYLGTSVKRVRADHVIVEKNSWTQEIPMSMFIWTAGVRANRLIEQSDLPDKNGSVEVTADMRVPHSKNVFVIGDSATIYHPEHGEAIPPTAQMAMQQGKICAKNIVAMIKGDKKEIKPFNYKEQGIIASLGKKDAIGILFNNKKIFGREAVMLKRLIENRVLYQLGGLSLLRKKKKF